MANQSVIVAGLLPLIMYFGGVIAITAVMLGGAYLLGQKHSPNTAADEAFESGIVPASGVQIRFSVHFYLLAIFFVIFDMEAVFLFAWSVAVKESGWAGFIEAAVFIGVLLAGLVYLWACGALDWRTRRQIRDETRGKT
jgi:NADH-quinone oxidoreductase subunit A